MGASSLSPSPMTIRPLKSMLFSRARMCSVAALSAAWLSPAPIHRALAIAAFSVTRTKSRERFLSIFFALPQVDEFLVVPRNHFHRLLAGQGFFLESFYCIPEYGSPDGKAYDAGDFRADFQPLADFILVLPPSERDYSGSPAFRTHLPH